jgi:shikimate kinase
VSETPHEPRNVVLAGPMGSGKSTVGRILAGWLGRQFVDTDTLVSQASGRTIPELFAEQGEDAFRTLEAQAIQAVCERRGLVVAVGGGAVVDPVNAARLRATAAVVVLEATPADLAGRVQGPSRAGKRPLLDDVEDLQARIEELARAREPAYAQVADVRVDTSGKPPEVVAAQVAAWLEEQP